MPRRLGLFGGTFDPPHLGHLAAARTVRDALGLDEVLLVPAGEPWQKTGLREVTAASLRIEMVRALVEGEERLGVDPSEVDRPGPSYSVETLEQWHRREPGVELFLVVGSDTAGRIHTWNRWQDLSGLSTIVVVNRAPRTASAIDGGLDSSRVIQVSMEPVDISSSLVREAVRRGESAAPWTGERVASIVAREHLYEESR